MNLILPPQVSDEIKVATDHLVSIWGDPEEKTQLNYTNTPDPRKF